MPDWRDHLMDDEKPYASKDDRSEETVHVLLLRLAHQRALYNNLVERHISRTGNRPPRYELSEGELKRVEEYLHEDNESLHLVYACESRGGCQWEPAVDEAAVRFYSGFPAEVCSHCKCSRQYNPPLLENPSCG